MSVNQAQANLPDIAFVYGQTDTANAGRFIDRYESELLFVPPWKRWLSWDGQRWADDHSVGALQRGKRHSASLWGDLAKVAPHVDRDELGKVQTFVKNSNQAHRIKAFLELAKVDPRVVCQVDELNADPNLLNVVNGTVDLETGKLRKHNPADRITQLASVVFDANATCPKWLEAIGLILNHQSDLIAYVQRLLGYSLSGSVGEHILPIVYGDGCNGKSTVWNTITALLGDYATLASEELLLGDRHNHPTEKADLYQKRFVAVSEPEQNAKLKEARVKELTGDRLIKARRMHEDPWEFERSHTFWLSTNHLPRLDGRDEGIWRRIKLIPFTVDLRTKVKPIPEFDAMLVREEGPGILNWLIQGYLDYKQHGLGEPQSVTAATSVYRADSDPLGEFLSEYTIDDADGIVTAVELFRLYSEEHKGKWSKTAFGKALALRYDKDKGWQGPERGKTIYKGLRLRSSDDFTEPPIQRETAKTQGKPHLQLVATSSALDAKENAKPIETPTQLVATGCRPTIRPCPECGTEAIPAPLVGDFRNWDCPSCGHLEKVNEATGQAENVQHAAQNEPPVPDPDQSI